MNEILSHYQIIAEEDIILEGYILNNVLVLSFKKKENDYGLILLKFKEVKKFYKLLNRNTNYCVDIYKVENEELEKYGCKVLEKKEEFN